MNEELDLLLSLYRAARNESTPAFQDAALRLVKPLIRFESAVWATGYRSGTDARPALVPILQLSHTHETDPAGVTRWREINRADKAIPVMLANPFVTCQIHSPTLFGSVEDAPMRDYTRRFGRQCALVTSLRAPKSPLIEWSVLYRSGADDHFSAAETARCQRLMLHLSEALCVNRLMRRASGLGVDGDLSARFDASAIVNRNGDVLAVGDSFVAECQREWAQFDGHRLPAGVMRSLVEGGQVRFRGRHIQFDARPLAELWWLTATAASGLPGRRMNAATLFAQGHTHKSVAKILGISPATVRNHIAASYRDLGVCSRTALRARLEQSGLMART